MVIDVIRIVASRIAAAAALPPTSEGLTSVATNLSVVGVTFVLLLCYPSNFVGNGKKKRLLQWSTSMDKKPKWQTFPLTLLGALIVPSLLEESLWRAALTPTFITMPAEESPSSSVKDIMSLFNVPLQHLPIPMLIVRTVIINLAFVLYHPLCSNYLPHFPPNKSVFADPEFLFMAFVLGCCCDAAFYTSGGALYAPTLVHGVTVAVWAEFLGGNEALGLE